MINFNLKDKSEKALIIMVYNYGKGKPFKYSTGEKIDSRYFHQHRAVLKGVDKETAVKHDLINRELARQQKALQDITDELKRQGKKYDNAILKAQLDKVLHGDSLISKEDFYVLFDEYVNLAKSGKRLGKKGTRISNNHLKIYGVFKALMQRFRETVLLSDINLAFYNDYYYFLNKNGYAKSTSELHINTLKTFIHWCNKNKYCNIDTSEFIAVGEDSDEIYLNKEDLQKIIAFNVVAEKQRSKDFFLLSCFLGQRYSDMLAINKNSFYDNYNYIKVIQRKTGKIVKMPTNTLMLDIFKKYGYKTPVIKSDATYNRQIKKICKLAGVTDKIEIKETKGFQVERNTYFKWQLVSSHTGRRTCASLMYLDGRNFKQIMEITGHSSVVSLMRYLRITNEENAVALKKDGGLFIL